MGGFTNVINKKFSASRLQIFLKKDRTHWLGGPSNSPNNISNDRIKNVLSEDPMVAGSHIPYKTCDLSKKQVGKCWRM